jgi:hypothetical protein
VTATIATSWILPFDCRGFVRSFMSGIGLLSPRALHHDRCLARSVWETVPRERVAMTYGARHAKGGPLGPPLAPPPGDAVYFRDLQNLLPSLSDSHLPRQQSESLLQV